LVYILAFCAIGIAVFAAMELRIVAGYLRLHHKSRGAGAIALQPSGREPQVLIQLPIYNEPAVAVQLLGAVAQLDYPRDRLRVQVLDDSTDDTPNLIAAKLAEIDPQGMIFYHIRRHDRQGYKAGALQYGLALDDSEFVAIFDADFLPPPDFLRRALQTHSPFHDPSVAFVQGRWTYYNRDQNMLTRVQSVLIDRHFFLQKPFQQDGRRTLHFNGSGGVWRRSAIDAAGGWTADTLCEDLDLTYRCALQGLTGVYDPALTCPSEIPQNLAAFKLQQRRWAKGSAQVATKLMAKVLRSGQLPSRIDDLHVLLGYLIHPLLLGFTLVWPWVVLAGTANAVLWACQGALILGNVAAFIGLITTFRARGDQGATWRRAIGDVIGSMVIGVSLMVNNAVAFASGMIRAHGVFERTPKAGSAAPEKRTKTRQHWTIWAEALLAIYGLLAGVILFADGHMVWGQQSFFMGCVMAYAVAVQTYPVIKTKTAAFAFASHSR
jgi:cellulose synthase/poly-beta-1,6-N-acetylglucosamine synthase-like glycosyltransferase